MPGFDSFSRRELLIAAGGIGLSPTQILAAAGDMRKRRIPSTGEVLPVIGLGTYSVFDVRGTPDDMEPRLKILAALREAGGSVIDSSPMYNRSEQIVGQALDDSGQRDAHFLATKIWTDGEASGQRQLAASAERMQAKTLDLVQVHNRRDMESHWPTILAAKEDGRVRYSGITDYRASANDSLLSLMRQYRPEFIQINYSLGERTSAERVLPEASERGIAVLINRPFVAGRLFRAVGERPLPDWSVEFAQSWGQFFLKYIVSHPAVTCVIPATSKLRHMVDNAGAGHGPLPDQVTRARMEAFIDSL